MHDNDQEYYQMREKRERDLAAQASNEKQQAIHLALAEEYAKLVATAVPTDQGDSAQAKGSPPRRR